MDIVRTESESKPKKLDGRPEVPRNLLEVKNIWRDRNPLLVKYHLPFGNQSALYRTPANTE
jgi:hypothetical protein